MMKNNDSYHVALNGLREINLIPEKRLRSSNAQNFVKDEQLLYVPLSRKRIIIFVQS